MILFRVYKKNSSAKLGKAEASDEGGQ